MVTEQFRRIFLGDEHLHWRLHIRPKYISPDAPQMFVWEVRGREDGLETFQTVSDRWLSELITL